jgi:hypothetical protein
LLHTAQLQWRKKQTSAGVAALAEDVQMGRWAVSEAASRVCVSVDVSNAPDVQFVSHGLEADLVTLARRWRGDSP